MGGGVTEDVPPPDGPEHGPDGGQGDGPDGGPGDGGTEGGFGAVDPPDWRREFAEEARSERPDLARLCLLIGAVVDPTVTPHTLDEAEIELDRLAGLVPYATRITGDWTSALAGLLGSREGFEGVPADYQRLESSLLHEVLRRRRGLPILLSVVWM